MRLHLIRISQNDIECAIKERIRGGEIEREWVNETANSYWSVWDEEMSVWFHIGFFVVVVAAFISSHVTLKVLPAIVIESFGYTRQSANKWKLNALQTRYVLTSHRRTLSHTKTHTHPFVCRSHGIAKLRIFSHENRKGICEWICDWWEIDNEMEMDSIWGDARMGTNPIKSK